MFGYLKLYVCFIILRFRELGWAHTKPGAVQRRRQDPKQSPAFCLPELATTVASDKPPTPIQKPCFHHKSGCECNLIPIPLSCTHNPLIPQGELQENHLESCEKSYTDLAPNSRKKSSLSQGDVLLNQSYLWSLVLTPIWDG